MTHTFKLEIEDHPEVLEKYGLAMALSATAELMLLELLKLYGGLNRDGVDPALVDRLLQNITFGSVLKYARSVATIDPVIIQQFDMIVSDRNWMAHSVWMPDQNGNYLLRKHSGQMRTLDASSLGEIIERTRNAIDSVYQAMINKAPTNVSSTSTDNQ